MKQKEFASEYYRMKFVDMAKVYVRAGRGGNGCISFRREKFIEFGGPDGGNGGRGGDVIVRIDTRKNTLYDFFYQKHFFAASGADGMKRNKTGKSGDDLVLYVPKGTQIWDDQHQHCFVDLVNKQQQYILATGGHGGLGNSMFKNSRRQAPRIRTLGGATVPLSFIFELSMFADIGLIGQPNVGKSTLIQTLTRAKSKIANYPFTTLNPVLGVFDGRYRSVVIADLPGLVEDAHKGVGLGIKFLRHARRCACFVHVIDVSRLCIKEDYERIRHELLSFDPKFEHKKEIIVLSKMDLIDNNHGTQNIVRDFENYVKKPVFNLSYGRCSDSRFLHALEDAAQASMSI